MSSKTIMWTLILLLMLATCLQSGMSLQIDNENVATLNKNATLLSASTAIHSSGLPKVDEIYFKAYPGALPETIVDEFISGEIDWMGGPARSDLYQLVVDAGHKVSELCPMAEFSFFPINCRDYKLASGNPNAPLNDSNWRLALSYVYGVDDKQADIYGYYGVPWNYALDNPVPPAQEPWYDASVVMPDTDNETAWSILSSAGYTVQDYDGQPWLHRNGIPVRPPDGPNNGKITLLYSGGTWVPDGPGGGMRDNWNAFIQDYLNADGPLMGIAPTDFMTMVTELMSTRDYDIVGIGLNRLGRYVDWICDLCHSDNDVDWGWNFFGIRDDDFDRWSEIMMASIDEDEVIEATENFTRKFINELMPWMPVITGSEFCTTARDERGDLTNVVPMDNYGPTNDWSYMTIHWKGEPNVTWPGGTVTVAMGDEPHSLNPWDEDTRYGWQIMDRALVGLTMVEPENLRNIPFVATDWEISHLVSVPELNIVDGCRVTFWLRQDVMWHDGEPVTAHDCVANMKFLREYKPGRYSNTWKHLVYEEVDGPYKFSAYFNESSLRYVDFVAGAALLAPEHIIEEIEGYWEDWEPCFTSYEDLGIGSPPAEYPFMKQLVGCGPFVFDYYVRETGIGHVARFNDFFVNAPVIGSVVGEWRISSEASYSYKPLVQNVAAMEANENGTFTDVTVDVKIYEDGVFAHEIDGLHLGSWNCTYLDTYMMEDVSFGPHTITIEVYGHNDSSLLHSYTHTFAAPIDEDLTTVTGEIIDFEVDMRDIGIAARAFGSYPDHPRWDPICDINDDYEVDITDLVSIARKFGWHY